MLPRWYPTPSFSSAMILNSLAVPFLRPLLRYAELGQATAYRVL